MTPEVRFFVCTAHHEFLSEAMRELEDKVSDFLKLGCSLHGPTSVAMQPETWRVRRRFYVSQPITKGVAS